MCLNSSKCHRNILEVKNVYLIVAIKLQAPKLLHHIYDILPCDILNPINV